VATRGDGREPWQKEGQASELREENANPRRYVANRRDAASERPDETSQPSYVRGTARDDLRDIGDRSGQPGMPDSPRSCRAGSATAHCPCASVEKVTEASIRTRTKARHRRPFRLVRRGTGSRPTCCTRCFGVDSTARQRVQPRNRRAGSTERLPAQDEVKPLKGEIPWMSSG